MAKLTYTRRSGGGSFKGRDLPGDKKVTEKEQRIIDFLRQTKDEQKEVSEDFIRSTSGVMDNEADNRQTLQNLKTDLWKTKVENVKKRRDTEVDYYEGLAKQAGEDAQFWEEFSPKLAEDVYKFGEGAMNTVEYLRDRAKDKENQRQAKAEEDGRIEGEEDEWGPGGQPPGDYDPGEDGPYEGPTPNQLQTKAFNTNLAESAKEQSKLHDEGDFDTAGVLYEQTFGRSANTKWWGTHYARKAVANFDQDYDSIVALAYEGVDPSQQNDELIEGSFYRYLKHKGVSLDSIAGREVSATFRKKLAATSTNRLQQRLAARDDGIAAGLQGDIRAALKSGNGLEQAVTQYVLHDARSHKMIGGKYSSPATRVINYGSTFDSLVEPLLKLHNWSSWDEFDEKILSLPIIADKNNYNLPTDHPKYLARPVWRKQREHMITSYKDLFVKTRDQEIKRARKIDEADIQSRIATLSLQTTDKSREDYIDKNSEEGRKQLWAKMKSAESQDEKAFIGDLLSYDPKSHVESTTHEQMLRALTNGDNTEFLWHFNNLKDYQKKFYQDLDQFSSRQELLKANWKYEDTEKHVESKVKSLLTENWSIDSNFESYEKAKKWGIQRFYDINETIDTEKFSNPLARINEVKRLLNEDFKDPNGLFKVGSVGNRDEFSYFMDDPRYTEPGWFRDKAEGLIEKFELNKPTLEEVNDLDLILEKDAINIMKDITTGTDGVRLPKILWDVHKKTGFPLVDIVNGQLLREGIPKKYNYKATEKALVKATQVEYLEQKAPKSVVDNTSSSNIPNVSAWYDVRDWFYWKNRTGGPVIEKTAEQLLLPFNLKKYNENNQSSLMDQLDVPYEVIEGRTRFADPEVAIRRGQEEGLVYNPWKDTMVEVS